MRLMLMMASISALFAGGANAQVVGALSGSQYAYVEQIGDTGQGGLARRTGGSSVTIRQDGDGNIINSDQSAAAQGTAVLYQGGSSNQIFLTQAGSAPQSAEVRQSGNQNDATVQQSDARNIAVLTQQGSGNAANLNQAGQGNGVNVATLSQFGYNNSQSVSQNGSGNTAFASQTGSGDTQSITQNGAGLSAAYVQIGNNLPDLHIVQNGFVAGSSASTVTITQTGSPFRAGH